MMVNFGREMCGNLEDALSREWLETNGLGGFSSSTIVNLNTRRYHGLLVAATRPPVGRLVMLAKLEETLVIDGRRFDLSANQYTGAIHPHGYEYQKGFRLDPFPIFTYQIESIEIVKTIFMAHGENTTIVQYDFRQADDTSAFRLPPSALQFEVRPLIAVRDYHSLARENEKLDSQYQAEENLLTVKPYAELPALYIAHDADAVETAGHWYRNFEYEIERQRGFDFKEDLFCPVVLRADVTARARLNFIISTEARQIARADEFRQSEVARRRAPAAATSPALEDDGLVPALIRASDVYIVARENQKTIIAGYHWFSDWGRDTMIALPGLTLVTGRTEIAKSILLEFARHTSRGMLPNRFPDIGETPEYNTVDATLWFFEAVGALLRYTDDYEFIRANLYETLTDIIRWHVAGTRYGIRVDDDGLLAAGEPGVQLTWMDAKVGDWVVTPRAGKAVEIQALWYNALRVMENLAARYGDASGRTQYAGMAEAARGSFNEKFWNEEQSCLYDVIDTQMRDDSVRPNQIFAVSLTHSMLSPERARRVVRIVERELLTPYGLRSLSPNDPRYRGRYEGDSLSRDGAYHQGTVWAWLMGAFITAYIKTHDDRKQAQGQAKKWLANFHTHLSEAGLGHVSEIFDGDAPHTPNGCIAQAWSVAELLRAAMEDVYAG